MLKIYGSKKRFIIIIIFLAKWDFVKALSELSALFYKIDIFVYKFTLEGMKRFL